MPTPRTHARSVSTCDILSLTLIIHDDEYRQTDKKAVALSTAFWVLCMAYMSRANDVSRAASNQSCNGRGGEKLQRKECNKAPKGRN